MINIGVLENKEKFKILARILAHLMGDGCVTDRYLRYNNKDETLLKQFKKDFEDIFGEVHFVEGKVNSGTSFIQVQNKEIINYFKYIISDFKSEYLRFPKFIRNKKIKKEFLRAIFDDEGCVGLRIFKRTNEIKRNLEMASKSKKFIEDVREILQTDFKIKCNKIVSFKRNLNGKEFTTWKLSITGKENFIKFRNKIDFSHPIKKQKLDLMIASYIRK